MRWATISSLASVLFKSYFRASRSGRRSIFSSPLSIAVIDLGVFVPICAAILYFLPQAPKEITQFLVPLTIQAVVSFPLLLTSLVILAGILFELGTSSGLASSESVNWLPVSPREYVVASCLSLEFAYSPYLFIGLAVLAPLCFVVGLGYVIPAMLALTLVAFFLGAVTVEILRSVTNRLTSAVYTKNRRLGTVIRMLLVVLLFAAIEVGFQWRFLSMALTVIVSGVSIFWFIPMVWPSIALLSQLSFDVLRTLLFIGLSAAFAVGFFSLSVTLRTRYWSPIPVVNVFQSSSVYVPQGRSFLWLDSTAFALAMKDIRSITRRKEMARFLSIPVVLVVVFFFAGTGAPGSVIGLLILGEISTLLPIMLSSISLGQEGKSIANIYMLPITPSELARGKLFLPTIMSGVAVAVVAALMQILFPLPLEEFLVLALAVVFIVGIQLQLGLGSGARFPDFTLGPRARYITGTGFFVTFVVGFFFTVVMLAPFIVNFATNYFWSMGLGPTGTTALVAVLTAMLGTLLLLFTRLYCNTGVKRFLEDMVF